MDQFVAIPAITVLCYLAAELYKAIAPAALYRHIPVLCGLAGALLGVLGFFLAPQLFIADNPLVAAAVGAVSGWAATGANQSIKQGLGK